MAGRRRWQAVSWALGLAGLAWLLMVAAGFWALGDPPPGPHAAEMLADKRLVAHGLLGAAGACGGLAGVLALLGYSQGQVRALLALALVGAQVSILLKLFVAGP